jgi:hypothetical protein
MGDVSCEPLHKSSSNLKSQRPPALRGLAWRHLSRLMTSIPSSIRNTQLVIEQRNGCRGLMLKNLKPD